MLRQGDTIAAIATAPGKAALGIVRISGPDAAHIIQKIVPKTRVVKNPQKMLLGRVINPATGVFIDEALCFFGKAPHTATGEDVAEIHGHGGPVVLRSVLKAVIGSGARAAEPGEFTYRAFLNKRMDLTQVEAVESLIGAETERAAQVAMEHLGGSVGQGIQKELDAIIGVSAELEVTLDFPDEDLPPVLVQNLQDRLSDVVSSLKKIVSTFSLGTRLTQGARIVIIGPPNAGKSSLLNALVDEERALVDEEPGTTRDVIEVRSEIGGISVLYGDTAGIRKNAKRIEQRGIDMAHNAMLKADVLLLVLDGSNRDACLDFIRSDTFKKDLSSDIKTSLVVMNKADLSNWSFSVPSEISSWSKVQLSALTGKGIKNLKQTLFDLLNMNTDPHVPILTTVRQYKVITETIGYLETAQKHLSAGIAPELAAADLKWARDKLASLWGKDATEDMLNVLFSTFCLGK